MKQQTNLTSAAPRAGRLFPLRSSKCNCRSSEFEVPFRTGASNLSLRKACCSGSAPDMEFPLSRVSSTQLRQVPPEDRRG